MPTLGKREEAQKFKVILPHLMSSKPVWATRQPVITFKMMEQSYPLVFASFHSSRSFKSNCAFLNGSESPIKLQQEHSSQKNMFETHYVLLHIPKPLHICSVKNFLFQELSMHVGPFWLHPFCGSLQSCTSSGVPWWEYLFKEHVITHFK